MKPKRIPKLKAGYWWATVRNGDPESPPCIWGKSRADARLGCDPDESVVKVFVKAIQ